MSTVKYHESHYVTVLDMYGYYKHVAFPRLAELTSHEERFHKTPRTTSLT